MLWPFCFLTLCTLFALYMLQEARALLGRLEYHRGNIEAALRVFDGIDLQTAIHRLKSSLADKPSPRKSRHHSELQHSTSQHAARLVLEAIYLKAKSLQILGRSFGKDCLLSLCDLCCIIS